MEARTPKFAAFLSRLVPGVFGAVEDEAQTASCFGDALFKFEGGEFVRGLIGLAEHSDDVAFNAGDVGVGQPALPGGGRQFLIGAGEPRLKQQADGLDVGARHFWHCILIKICGVKFVSGEAA